MRPRQRSAHANQLSVDFGDLQVGCLQPPSARCSPVTSMQVLSRAGQSAAFRETAAIYPQVDVRSSITLHKPRTCGLRLRNPSRHQIPIVIGQAYIASRRGKPAQAVHSGMPQTGGVKAGGTAWIPSGGVLAAGGALPGLVLASIWQQVSIFTAIAAASGH